jgi:hypothetical protein
MKTLAIFSKLLIFLVFSNCFVLLQSCKKSTGNIIADTFVDFTISLNDPLFIDLNSIGNSVIVNSSYFGPNSSGYKDHGIIIYRASQTEFYAFDRTCTWEENLDQAVELDLPADLSAECPECGSHYILPSYGYPDNDGPAQYPLKNYNTQFDGTNIWVYNQFK